MLLFIPHFTGRRRLVVINSITNQDTDIWVKTDASIGALRDIVSDELGIGLQLNITLHNDDVELVDGRALSDYNIPVGDAITVTTNPPGALEPVKVFVKIPTGATTTLDLLQALKVTSLFDATHAHLDLQEL